MLPPHVDVDIPPSLMARRGSLLAALDSFARRRSFHTRREDKEPGNHLTPWWLYVRFNNYAPSKSEAQFGATDFADVNPVPHMWSRAKVDYRDAAQELLQDFMRAMVAAASAPPPPLIPPRPCRPVPLPVPALGSHVQVRWYGSVHEAIVRDVDVDRSSIKVFWIEENSQSNVALSDVLDVRPPKKVALVVGAHVLVHWFGSVHEATIRTVSLDKSSVNVVWATENSQSDVPAVDVMEVSKA